MSAMETNSLVKKKKKKRARESRGKVFTSAKIQGPDFTRDSRVKINFLGEKKKM